MHVCSNDVFSYELGIIIMIHNFRTVTKKAALKANMLGPMGRIGPTISIRQRIACFIDKLIESDQRY